MSDVGSIYQDQFNGGAGRDVIRLDAHDGSGHYEVDFSLIDASNIEELWLLNITVEQYDIVSVTVQDVLDMTDINNIFTFYGNTDDSITSIGQGWVQGVDVINAGGLTLNSYTSGGATLLIDEDIVQTIS